MRSLFVVVVLTSLVLVSALAVIEFKHQSRTLYNQLQVLRVERDQMQTEWAQLQLEESAWANRGRVEHIARSRLDMHEPTQYSIVVVKQ